MAKKKSKIRSIMKWIRRITYVAGIVGAVRQWQTDKNTSKQPPQQ